MVGNLELDARLAFERSLRVFAFSLLHVAAESDGG